MRSVSVATLVLAMLSACSSETTPRTEIVIVVDSDLAAPSEIDRISVRAGRDVASLPASEESSDVGAGDQRGLPKTVTVLYTGGSLGPLRIRATAFKNNAYVMDQEARVSFVLGKRMMLHMRLVRACLPSRSACTITNVCVDGACTNIERDDELVPWTELDGGSLNVTDAGNDASTDGGSDSGTDAGQDAQDDDAGGEDAGQDTGPACISSPEQCNGEDDDCDENVDEGFDLNSIEHCGSCENVCPINLLNARSVCDQGTCAIECLSNTDDCDGMLSTGCETNLTTPTDCGTCENACGAGTPFCGFNGSTLGCVGACGALTLCDGTSCVDTQTDPLHCGGCTPCAAQSNASADCDSGACDYTCFDGYASCSDSNDNNGCETNIRTDPAHCDACNAACADRDNSSPRCVNGTCDIACDNGFTDCDTTIATGCETNTNGDANNCGSCNNACPARTNATPTCSGGTCSFMCNAGRANCDTNPANGCEVNTLTSKGNCGTCGNNCALLGLLGVCCNGTCRLGC